MVADGGRPAHTAAAVAATCLHKSVAVQIESGEENADFAELTQVLVGKAKSADDLTQYVALRWLNCFLTHPRGDAQTAMMHNMADLITAVLPCLSRRSPDIRDTAVSCNSRLLSLNLSRHLAQPGMRPVLAALGKELSSQQQPTRLEALQWFQARCWRLVPMNNDQRDGAERTKGPGALLPALASQLLSMEQLLLLRKTASMHSCTA